MRRTFLLFVLLALCLGCQQTEKKADKDKEKAPAEEAEGAEEKPTDPEGEADKETPPEKAETADEGGESPDAPDTAPAAGIPDTQIGLSKASVFDTPEPAAYAMNATEPGDEPIKARPFANAPPVMPHGAGEYLPITLENNACMDCHDGGGGKAIPASHKTDLRTSPHSAGEGLVGARHNCVACHMPQSNAQPLVENQFNDNPLPNTLPASH